MDPGSSPLLTDLYQLNRIQAYLAYGETKTAVFELFVRKRLMPKAAHKRSDSTCTGMACPNIRAWNASTGVLRSMVDRPRFAAAASRRA